MGIAQHYINNCGFQATTEIESKCFSPALEFLGEINNLTRHQYPHSMLRLHFSTMLGLNMHLVAVSA